MWLFFTLATTLLWGVAELFYKKGSHEENKYDHLRVCIIVGAVMGIHAVFTLLTSDIVYDPKNLIEPGDGHAGIHGGIKTTGTHHTEKDSRCDGVTATHNHDGSRSGNLAAQETADCLGDAVKLLKGDTAVTVSESRFLRKAQS